MGYVPEPWVHGSLDTTSFGGRNQDDSPALNLDRHGMPRDYATYVWLLYGKRVEDRSPTRRALDRGTWPDRDPTIRPEQR